MTCNRENIYLYLDNELSQPERTAIEVHLRKCKLCAGELRTQSRLMAELDGLSDVETPSWLEQRIIQRTQDDLSVVFQSRDERRLAVQAVIILGILAAAFVRFDVVSNFLMAMFAGLRIVGTVLWKIFSVSVRGISYATLGLVHGLADDAHVTPLPAILLAVILTLVLIRLMTQLTTTAGDK